jgi:hypothetical protein
MAQKFNDISFLDKKKMEADMQKRLKTHFIFKIFCMMNCKFLTVLLLALPLSMLGQNLSKNIITRTVESPPLLSNYINTDLYLKSVTKLTLDTLPSIMLITECDNCNSKQHQGYAVIEVKTKTKGWISDFAYQNEDIILKKVIKYLDYQKAEIPENIIVWQSKEK